MKTQCGDGSWITVHENWITKEKAWTMFMEHVSCIHVNNRFLYVGKTDGYVIVIRLESGVVMHRFCLFAEYHWQTPTKSIPVTIIISRQNESELPFFAFAGSFWEHIADLSWEQGALGYQYRKFQNQLIMSPTCVTLPPFHHRFVFGTQKGDVVDATDTVYRNVTGSRTKIEHIAFIKDWVVGMDSNTSIFFIGPYSYKVYCFTSTIFPVFSNIRIVPHEDQEYVDVYVDDTKKTYRVNRLIVSKISSLCAPDLMIKKEFVERYLLKR